MTLWSAADRVVRTIQRNNLCNYCGARPGESELPCVICELQAALGEHARVGCDCCDHPLQHLIHRVIARYEAPIPPPTHRETIQSLRNGLQDWEDSR